MICSKFQTPRGRPCGQTENRPTSSTSSTILAERARLRSRLEHAPENAVGRPTLERLYEAMTEEFCRRARIAWTRSRLAAEDDVDRVRKAVGRVTGLAGGKRP